MSVCSLCLSYSEEFVMSNVINGMDRFGYFEVRSARDGDAHVIAPIGELDIATAPEVQQELERVEATDARSIVLDLSGLTFISTIGIQIVLEAEARSRANGSRLTLLQGPTAVHRAFEISGLLDRLPFDG